MTESTADRIRRIREECAAEAREITARRRVANTILGRLKLTRMNAELRAAELNRTAATGEDYKAVPLTGGDWSVVGKKNGQEFYTEE